MPEFTIKITFNPDTKDCRVEGPLRNKELCDLGFELARGVIEQHRRRTIVPVQDLSEFLKKRQVNP